MRRRRWLIAAALLLLLFVFVLWQAPAGWALKIAQAGNPGLAWSTASGSAWNGRARNVYWQGLALGEVQWRMAALEGMSGPQTRWELWGESTQYHLRGMVSVAGNELRRIERLEADVPAAWIDLNQVAPFVYLTGRLKTDITQLQFRDNFPVSGRGTIDWIDAGLGGLVNESLGGLHFEIRPSEPDSDRLNFEFRSKNHVDIHVTGRGHLHGDEYAVNLQLAISEVRQDLRELLRAFGEVGPDGRIVLEWRGKFFP